MSTIKKLNSDPSSGVSAGSAAPSYRRVVISVLGVVHCLCGWMGQLHMENTGMYPRELANIFTKTVGRKR